MTDDGDRDGARRRRPAAEHPAARRGADPARLRRPCGVVRRGGAGGPARGADVDLVLLDIVMPGMDGYEVCRRIRREPGTAYLPVVMITASGDEQKIKALEAGADDFLTKPFDQSELLARVASLARIKRYQDTIKRQADELAAWNRELEEPGARPRSPSSSGWAGCAGSCRRSWPSWSSTPATSRSSRATAARSSSCSATCAASRRSPRRASPRR